MQSSRVHNYFWLKYLIINFAAKLYLFDGKCDYSKLAGSALF